MTKSNTGRVHERPAPTALKGERQDSGCVGIARKPTRGKKALKRAAKKTATQQTFGFARKRKGGRPRIRSAGVSHSRRPKLRSSTPVHVTISFVDGLPSMRGRRWMQLITGIIGEMREAWRDAWIVEYTIQSNHMHVLCEAKTEGALATLMKSFKTRLTLRLNRHLGRKGTAYTERYHRTDLDSPTETRNALRYVLRNDVHHSSATRREERAHTLDGCSSATWHGDFRDQGHPIADKSCLPPTDPTSSARSWRLSRGYSAKGGGPLSIEDLPKPAGSLAK